MRFRAVPLAAMSLLAGTVSAQTPQGTSFTYQGRLADGGAPADGAFDLRFILYDAAVGGSQVGPIVSRDDVVVSGGLFTVPLDFGASFAGNRRWLDVAVRPGASTGTYTSIAPRQELTSTPSALFSAATPWMGVAGKPAGFADDIDDDTLDGLGCAAGEVPKSSGSAWACAPDSGHSHHGQTWAAPNAIGLTVESGATSGTGIVGIVGRAVAGPGGRGVVGLGDPIQGTGVSGEGGDIGVRGQSATSFGSGVFGWQTSSTGSTTGVQGWSASSAGRGVSGVATATTGGGIGVHGQSNSSTGYAGYFTGRLHVDGTLSKSAGSFRIDHPLDPERKYLYHSFVESPDMKNVYDGIVTTDEEGFATVAMPDWFEALNRDFRYQLTVIGDGAWARARVFRGIEANAFVEQTDRPRVVVSWQVTGVRHDAYAEKHRIPVEQDKPPGEQGAGQGLDFGGGPGGTGPLAIPEP